MRVVLDAAAYLAGAFGAREPGDQVEGHVDAGGDAGAGDEVAVVDEPGRDVGATVGSSSESRFSDAQWVVAGLPLSSPAAA